MYQAAKVVKFCYYALIEQLETIEYLMDRCEIYTNLPLTVAMCQILAKNMQALRSTLGPVTE